MDDIHAHLLAHRDWLQRLAFDLVRTEAAADVAQETLRIAFERPPATAGTVRVWLAKVAQRVAWRMQRADSRRAIRERERAAAAEDRDATTPEHITAQQQWAVAVAEAVRDLDDPYRTAVHLRYYEDLAPTAIAERMAVPVATVKTRLQRAKELLRRRLDQHGAREDWCAALVALLPVARRASAVAGFSAGKLAVAGVVALLALLLVPLACVFGEHGTQPTPAASTVTDNVAAGAGRGEAAALVLGQDPARQAPAGVRARCVLADGSPVGGVEVLVCIGPARNADKSMWTRAERCTSDADGVVAVAVPDGLEVMFAPTDVRWRTSAKQAGSQILAVAPTTTTIELAAVPTARLRIRAHDSSTGETLRTFTCAMHGLGPDSHWPGSGGSYHGSYEAKETVAGEVEMFVAMTGGESTRVQVDLRSPRGSRERFTVRAGETREVVLAVAGGEHVAGTVVDGAGKPIAGALVFAGTQLRARGDEPGKPFRAARIRDGVTTDANGAFRLTARDHVTAWHPEFGARTVRRASAQRIGLEPLVAVAGTLVDAAGVPRADVELRLDRDNVARTDAAGSFRFDRVEPGRRLVTGEGAGPWFVAAGAVEPVTLSPGLLELRLAIRGHGEARTVALVGLGPVATFATAPIEQDHALLRGVLPGDHVLLTDRGGCRRVTVTGPELAAEFGGVDANCTLAVAVADATTVHLVPADADEMTRVLAARVIHVRVEADGEVRLGPLTPGDYELCRGDEPHGLPVVVHGAETKIRLE